MWSIASLFFTHVCQAKVIHGTVEPLYVFSALSRGFKMEICE